MTFCYLTKKHTSKLNDTISVIDDKFKWKFLSELAGNGAKTKTITVPDVTSYSEMLLLCGPAIAYQTHRVLASTVIPYERFASEIGDDNGNGRFQAMYQEYSVGFSIMSNTSIKLYANNNNSLCALLYR